MVVSRVIPDRTVLSTCLVGALVGSLLMAWPRSAASSPEEPPTLSSPDAADPAAYRLDSPRTVTLVTGHRVTLTHRSDGPPLVTVDGTRADDDVRIRRDGDLIEVIPTEVAGLVPQVLDPRLFDVAGLVAMGYDDARRPDLPLIVRRAPGTRAIVDRALVERERALPDVGAMAVTLAKGRAREFGDDLGVVAQAPRPGRAAAEVLGGFDKVWLDAKVAAASVDASAMTAAAAAPPADYLTQIGAPEAWAAGLEGDGVTIAVLDTGVDAQHPALDDAVTGSADLTGGGSPADVQGHGTHVASLIAGDGDGSDGVLRGVSPGADLLNSKVLGDDGFGQESWLLAGMEWAVAQGADVVNMSLGARAGDTDDLLAQAVDTYSAETDTLFVVAAGNDGGNGPDPGTIGTPGIASAALTVASVGPGDGQSLFSGEGPVRGSQRAKPDLTAPGEEIPGALVGARTGDPEMYVPMWGTSQATPQITGAAALLLEQHPGWDGEQAKRVLTSTADPLALPNASSVGSGRLAVERAIAPVALVAPGTLGFGALRHGAAEPRTLPVAVTNSSPEPLDLAMSVDVVDAFFEPAPDDLVTINTDALVLQPGETGAVQVTLDPAASTDNTYWQGRVRLTAGGEPLLDVPLSAYDEPELYTLDVSVLDRSGNPVDQLAVPVQNLETGGFATARVEDGHAAVRVPPGPYSVIARVPTPAPGGQPASLTVAGVSQVQVEQDVAVTIDARDARRVRPPRVAGDRTEAKSFSFTWDSTTDDGAGYGDLVTMSVPQILAGGLFVQEMAPSTTGRLESSVRWRLVPTRRTGRDPHAYELHWRRDGVPGPFSPDLSRGAVRRLAAVTTRFHEVSHDTQHVVGLISRNGLAAIVHRRRLRFPRVERTLVTASREAVWAQSYTVPAGASTEATETAWRWFRPASRPTISLGRSLHPGLFWLTQGPYGSIYAEVGVDDGRAEARIPWSSVRSSRLSLFRNGRWVSASNDVFAYFEVPDDAATYRLVNDLELKRGRTPVTGRTAWTFRSRAPLPDEGDHIPPLLTVDYGPAVDLRQRAPARRPLRFRVGFGHQLGSGVSARVAEVRLRWSTGGAWRGASVDRTGPTSFRVTVPGRRLRAGRELSLWLRATDTQGNGLDQRVRDLVRIR